jgi:hypothetical protein
MAPPGLSRATSPSASITLDHTVLVSILGERIHDNRFLRLIENLLQAGYLEDWTYNATLSGAPQGGVVSPILSNIYLDRLDKFVEQTLLPTYNRGPRRRAHPTYKGYEYRIRQAEEAGDKERARALRQERRQVPSIDPADPAYRRLRYVRYADDFLLGFAGPRCEAEEIKRRLGEFISATLHLTLSQDKTLITHARTEAARFLGYDISVYDCDTKLSSNRRRSINGNIALKVPRAVIETKCAAYMRNGKPIHRPERLHDSIFSIVEKYQQEYRGVVQYYLLAVNVRLFSKLDWVMETSLAKTLAAKQHTSVTAIWKKYKATIQTTYGPYTGLEVILERGDGKKPLRAHWGGVPLRTQREVSLNDTPPQVWNKGTELAERLLADTCELCGSHEKVQVHHIRRLKDLDAKAQGEKPRWVKMMAARHRKTLVVCHACHVTIHGGRYDGTKLSRI